MAAINLAGMSFYQPWVGQYSNTMQQNFLDYQQHYQREVLPLAANRQEFALKATDSLKKLLKLFPKAAGKASELIERIYTALNKVLKERSLLSSHLSFESDDDVTTGYINCIERLREVLEGHFESFTNLHEFCKETAKEVKNLILTLQDLSKLMQGVDHERILENTDVYGQKKSGAARHLKISRYDWYEFNSESGLGVEKPLEEWSNQKKELQKNFLERAFGCKEARKVDLKYSFTHEKEVHYLLTHSVKDLQFVRLEVGNQRLDGFFQESDLKQKKRISRHVHSQYENASKQRITSLYKMWLETCRSSPLLTEAILLIVSQANKLLKSFLSQCFSCSSLTMPKKYDVWLVKQEEVIKMVVYRYGELPLKEKERVYVKLKFTLHIKELMSGVFVQSRVVRSVETDQKMAGVELLKQTSLLRSRKLQKVLLLKKARYYQELSLDLYKCSDLKSFALLEKIIDIIPKFWGHFFKDNFFLRNLLRADEEILEKIKSHCPSELWESEPVWEPVGFALSHLAVAINQKNLSAVRFLNKRRPSWMDNNRFFINATEAFRKAVVKAPEICNYLLANGFMLSLAEVSPHGSLSKYSSNHWYSPNLSAVTLFPDGIVVEQLTSGVGESFWYEVTSVPSDSESKFYQGVKLFSKILNIQLPARITKTKINCDRRLKSLGTHVRVSKSVSEAFGAEPILKGALLSESNLLTALPDLFRRVTGNSKVEIVIIDDKLYHLFAQAADLMAAIYCYYKFNKKVLEIEKGVGDHMKYLSAFFSQKPANSLTGCERLMPKIFNSGNSFDYPETTFQKTVNRHARKEQLDTTSRSLLRNVKKVAAMMDVISVEPKSKEELLREQLAKLEIASG